MTESEWAVWCLSCASTWLGASPYGALPLAVPVKARLQRREILHQRAAQSGRENGKPGFWPEVRFQGGALVRAADKGEPVG